MNVSIIADIRETGDPRRGYYSQKGTVTFQFAPGEQARYIYEHELEILTAMLPDRKSQMWYGVEPKGDYALTGKDLWEDQHVYTVSYGVDSSD